jgi:hypothetical protein
VELSRCASAIHLHPLSQREKSFVISSSSASPAASPSCLNSKRANHSSALAHVRLHSYIELYFDKCTAAGHYLSSSLSLDPSSPTRPASSSAEMAIERSGSLTSVVKKPRHAVQFAHCTTRRSIQRSIDLDLAPRNHESPIVPERDAFHKGAAGSVGFLLQMRVVGKSRREKNAVQKDGWWDSGKGKGESLRGKEGTRWLRTIVDTCMCMRASDLSFLPSFFLHRRKLVDSTYR